MDVKIAHHLSIVPYMEAFLVSMLIRVSNPVTGSRIPRDWANPESRGILRTGFSGLIYQFWYSYFKDFMTVLGVNLLLTVMVYRKVGWSESQESQQFSILTEQNKYAKKPFKN